jgi:hypothetical protein
MHYLYGNRTPDNFIAGRATVLALRTVTSGLQSADNRLVPTQSLLKIKGVLANLSKSLFKHEHMLNAS